MRPGRVPLILLAVSVLPCACGAFVLTGSMGAQEWAAGASTCRTPSPSSPGAQWGEEQMANATAIVSKGRSLGVADRGIVIALATAMQESTLRNVNYGDSAGPDSRGLFQQRDSWGPIEVRMNPEGAAGLFYARLLAVPGWESLPLHEAAQRVQRSAFPIEYAKWEDDAMALLTELAGVGPSTCEGGTVVAGWALPLPPEHIHPPMREHHHYAAVDIGVPVGAPVFAITGGVVRLVPDGGSCGLGVAIVHEGAEWLYCHASSVTVATGEEVPAGTQVMLSGGARGAPGAGSSTAPHLHVQLRYGGALRCVGSVIDALAAGQAPPAVGTLSSNWPCLRSEA